MKINYKKIFEKTILITGVALISLACNENHQADGKTATLKEKHAMRVKKKVDNNVDFLMKAVEIDLKEIDLDELAQQKSKSVYVKDMAIRLEKQHLFAMNQLNGLAQKRTIIMPIAISQDDKSLHDTLSLKTGKNFDIEYCTIMVNDYTYAISLYEQALKESTDREIKTWITSALPILKANLNQIIKCKEKAML